MPDSKTARESAISWPDVWDDDPTCSKYFKWGFATKIRVDNGKISTGTVPVEPDLLGELFVLGGFEHICTALKGNKVPLDNTLQNLALGVWHEIGEKAPAKLLSFFLRCAQDFPNNEQLKDIVIFLAKPYTEISDDTLKHKVCLEWAKLVANLVDHYIAADKMEIAQNIFDATAGLGVHNDIAIQRARAAYSLIDASCSADNLEKAKKVFKDMADLGEHQEKDFLHVHASSAFILAYIRAGDLGNAEKVFEDIADLSSHEDEYSINTERASVAGVLINAYIRAGDLEKIEKIIKTIGRMGDLPDHTVLRTKAYAHLIDAYGKAGDLKKAKIKYDAMSGLVGDIGDHKYTVLADRAQVSFNLIRYYIKAGTLGDIAEAQNIYDDMIKLDDQIGIAKREHIGVAKSCAWAAIHLQYAYVKDYPPDNIRKIHKIYDTMTSNHYFKEFLLLIGPDTTPGIPERVALAKLDAWLIEIAYNYDSVIYYTDENMKKLKKIYETWASNSLFKEFGKRPMNPIYAAMAHCVRMRCML